MSAKECLFCRIAEGKAPARVIYDDGRVLAFADVNPQAPVHVLVIPREHIGGPAQVGEQEEPLVGHVFGVASKLAKQLGLAEEGFRLVINGGLHGGQTIYHLHVHLLGGRQFSWPPG